jgi:hypothetical protein
MGLRLDAGNAQPITGRLDDEVLDDGGESGGDDVKAPHPALGPEGLAEAALGEPPERLLGEEPERNGAET